MFKATLTDTMVKPEPQRIGTSNMMVQETANTGVAGVGGGGGHSVSVSVGGGSLIKMPSQFSESIPSGGSSGGGDAPFLGIKASRPENLDDKSTSMVVDPSKFPPMELKFQSMQGKQNFPISRYSRKVFVGGLPPDIDESRIIAAFRYYGPLYVDWPHKSEYYSKHPPKGYAFLIFQDEASVRNLIDACLIEDDKLYLYVSSVSINNKPVQVRPWRICDAECDLGEGERDQRKTVFVGGVPRPMKAVELAMIMNRLYGNVCYAAIDTDPEMKYPKGAGRITFSTHESYVKALNERFVQLQHGDIDKRVEIKPYVLDNQQCDICVGRRSCGVVAPFFCPNISCLRYYCTPCWADAHTGPGREFHRPLVKEGNDRPRSATFRW